VKSVDRVKFLDYKFTGSAHISHLYSKCAKLLNIIKMLRGIWCGSHPSDLLTIFRMIIRFSIEYGCFVFAGASHSHFKKLEQIQFKVLRLALGFRKSTPTNILLAEAVEWPLNIRFSYLTSRYLLRVREGHPLLDKLSHLDSIVTAKNNHGISHSYMHIVSFYLRLFAMSNNLKT